MPLDDLVDAPEVGDSLLRLKPGRVKGRIVVPLTREPGGMQAWKIVVPTTKITPELRAHDGRERICVLSGRVRLILGKEDRILCRGDVVEFDTREPHWFGSSGDAPAELLSIFCRPGARMIMNPFGRRPPVLAERVTASGHPVRPLSPETYIRE